MNTTPAGWYPDDRGAMRYWDGWQWTDHVAQPPRPGAVSPYGEAPVQPYGQGYVQPYGQAGAASSSPQGNGVGIAGFVVGLVSVFLPLVFGLVAGITGLVLSIIGVGRAAAVGQGKGLSIAGIVLSGVGILFIL